MIRPYVPEQLFDLSDNYKIVMENDVIIVDNIYKNYDEIYDLITNMPVPIWKYTASSHNFKDYYDCRPILKNWPRLGFPSVHLQHQNVNEILEIIGDYYGELRLLEPVRVYDFEFNFFKHINLPPSSDYQFQPHLDYPYAGIVYLDKVCSGGTAIYDVDPFLNKGEHKELEKEEDNVMADVSKFKIKHLIPAKPNRLVLFKGKQIHGGYIADHSAYLNDWRINQIMFFSYVKGERYA